MVVFVICVQWWVVTCSIFVTSDERCNAIARFYSQPPTCDVNSSAAKHSIAHVLFVFLVLFSAPKVPFWILLLVQACDLSDQANSIPYFLIVNQLYGKTSLSLMMKKYFEKVLKNNKISCYISLKKFVMQCFATCKQMIGLFMGFVNNQKNEKYQTYLMLIRSTFI